MQKYTAEQQEYLAKKDKQTIPIPTDPDLVIEWLRILNEPKTLFGEGPHERRQRLEEVLLADQSGAAQRLVHELSNPLLEDQEQLDDDDDDEFFVPGCDALLDWRRRILRQSIIASQLALCKERQRPLITANLSSINKSTLHFKSLQLANSQYASTRPICAVNAFTSNASTMIIAGDFGGALSWWDSNLESEIHQSPSAHSSRISNIAISSWKSISPLMATGDAQGRIALWSLPLDAEPNTQWEITSAHTNRVGAVQFHPTSHLMGSCSFDQSWRLWDVQTQQQVSIQEGHTNAIYAMAFHDHGALACTAGLDGLARLWDLRTGRSIWTMTGGHSSQSISTGGITSCKFAPGASDSSVLSNPMLVATGGEDGMICIWDLRKTQILYRIPAHSSVVSCLSFCRDYVLSSAGFDGSIKFWNLLDASLIQQLTGHDGKILDLTCTSMDTICSAGFDRSLKLWSVSG